MSLDIQAHSDLIHYVSTPVSSSGRPTDRNYPLTDITPLYTLIILKSRSVRYVWMRCCQCHYDCVVGSTVHDLCTLTLLPPSSRYCIPNFTAHVQFTAHIDVLPCIF